MSTFKLGNRVHVSLDDQENRGTVCIVEARPDAFRPQVYGVRLDSGRYSRVPESALAPAQTAEAWTPEEILAREG